MEARRLERRRRDSAKNSAAPVLPSSQDKDFHLRLIDLYQQHECLWNTSLKEYQDVELKRQAWADIASKLGSHLSASFVRSRISSLRYRLNVYKLQMLEFKMSPSSGKQPEKHYYIDKFAFLDSIIHSQEQEQNHLSEIYRDSRELSPNSTLSIASIFKQRMQEQDRMPNVLQRLSVNGRDQETGNFKLDDFSDLSIASVVKKRMHQLPLLNMQSKSDKNTKMVLPKFRESLLNASLLLQQTLHKKQTANESVGVPAKPTQRSKTFNLEIDDMLKKRMHRLSLIEEGKDSPHNSLDDVSECRDPGLNIPSVIKKRMRQQFSLGPQRGLAPVKISSKNFPTFSESMLNVPQAPSALRALPGDSVSKTKVTKYSEQPNSIELQESKEQSDDDELYRLHWSVRQQNRTRRPALMAPNHDIRLQPLPPSFLLGTRSELDTNMESALKAKS
ncbi:hypothetical protein ACLKA7_001550 [Drosophila subpalustris]